MNDKDLYAPRYTRGQRLRFVLIVGPVLALLMVVSETWIFPWITAFAESAPCSEWLGVPGMIWLAYGLFVGLPATLLPFGVYAAIRARRIVREQRFPPAKEKVLDWVKIRRGATARFIGYAHYSLLAFILVFMLWGYFAAGRFLQSLGWEGGIRPSPACEAIEQST